VNHRGEVGYRSRLELALIAMQQNRLDEARQALEAMLAAEPDPKWRAECNLGLSRVARREKKYDDAVEFARASVHAADGLERIRRRAHTVLVLALYDAAIAAGDDERRDFHLKATLREIERALMPSAEPDVRTRANLLLTRARVFKTQGDIAAALDVYKEFEAIKPLVEVGRIHELAKLVEKELAPVMNTFRCPADHVPPVWNLDVNLDALREYVKEKAERKFKTGRARAAALGRSRGNLYADLKKPKNGVPRKRAGRGSGSATGRKKSN
jgi:tetratricopeptide (TPR) repeat protein